MDLRKFTADEFSQLHEALLDICKFLARRFSESLAEGEGMGQQMGMDTIKPFHCDLPSVEGYTFAISQTEGAQRAHRQNIVPLPVDR